MTPTKTRLQYGTLAELIAARKSATLNEEQYEAFVIEFYLNVTQIVNNRANAFSLISQMTLPRMNREADSVTVEFTRWAVAYEVWTQKLFQFERDVLATVRVIWS